MFTYSRFGCVYSSTVQLNVTIIAALLSNTQKKERRIKQILKRNNSDRDGVVISVRSNTTKTYTIDLLVGFSFVGLCIF